MKNVPHESGKFHVTGEAVYIDDMKVSDRLLYGRVVYSPHAHAKIKSFDLSKAEKLKGVHAVLTYKDIPGHNQMGPIFHDEPVLAVDEVTFIGQAMFLVAAESEAIAYEAAKLIKVDYELLEPVLSIEAAIEKGDLIQPARKIECGDVEKALKESKHIINGELKTGGQEHWYLETQVSLCIPGEGSDMMVYSSTQNPTETQALVAEVLGIKKNEVEVQTRRLGGGFGGKETQANHTANWAALLARVTGRPVKIRLFRDDDQKITGKRHRFLFKYKVGFNDEGIINAIDVEQNADAGAATDLSMAILERAMMHAENAYFIPNMRIIGNAWKTNLPSNTAYRGFGGPQGMACMETIVDRIARNLGKDALEIRTKNFYGLTDRNVTPYGQVVENNRLHLILEQIIKTSGYHERKKEIDEFNAKNEFYKKGIALTPIKFGISFTTSFLNQAGALVNVYRDGSVLVNHGGVEMGQGLNTKMKQIAASEFGIDIEFVKVNATNTAKVPNASPTAASSGADMNGMAVKIGVDKIKERIAKTVADDFNRKNNDSASNAGNISFENNTVFDTQNKHRCVSFVDAVNIAYLNRESLSATGYYRTPGVHFDRDKGKGNPFYYFSYGMSVTEVLVDLLTGYTKILRADILHDVGDSLNPNIDKGQIEGAFIQGMGWCTTEELKWDASGNLLNHSPDTYKIPTVQDIPEDFRVDLLLGAPQPGTIHSSKAVGEPPFMLAFSCWLAIKYAISATGNHKLEPDFAIPATNEAILMSVENLKKAMRKKE